jgi:tRNA pseudouridine13 synthase
MREAPPLEREMGMRWYVSDADGTGGELRAAPEDFVVSEVEQFDVEVHPVDADPGAYPHLVFRATLHGWDTNDFAGALSDRLGMSRERVSWAGTKDKHAVTTQLFSVRYDGADLPDLRDAEVAVLGRAGRPVLFGDLAGNAFEIRARDAEHPEHAEAVTRALRAFAADDDPADAADGTTATVAADDPAGVPNYFGHQRFGAYRPVTHRAGLAVVREDWRDAVLTYVTETSPAEPTETRAAREFVAETRDWGAALEELPGALRYERAMVHTLAERVGEGEPDPEDWRAALESLPSNLQTLLVNAAQSYAFNLMLSERLERGLPFGRAVAGDVVCFAARGGPEELSLPDTDRRQRVDADRVDTVNRHCERGRAFVTAPLVGTDTELGDGEPGEVERAVLDDLGLEPGDFDLPGAFGSTGTRRAILLRTALDIERDGADLRFAFALPKGSYATVVLREYLKDEPAALT